MHKVTVTETFRSIKNNITNISTVDKQYGSSLTNFDICKSSKQEYSMRDMLNLLEIKTNVKKLLHAPSLKIFIFKKFQKSPNLSKKKMYLLLRAWQRMVKSDCYYLINFHNVYFDEKNDIVYLNFEYTGNYPLKVI